MAASPASSTWKSISTSRRSGSRRPDFFFTSPRSYGESIGRLQRPSLRTRKRSFGYARSDRVRGYLRESNLRKQPLTPTLSPQKRGEGENKSGGPRAAVF